MHHVARGWPRPEHSRTDGFRFAAAVTAAVAAGRAARMVGHHATSLPGLLAERIDPSILRAIGSDIGPVAMVLGTNGKTTTTRLLARIVASVDGTPPITNESGANLRQGIVTALIDGRRHATHARRRTPVVLEVDELAFSGVAASLRPKVVVVLNLLRDQLDRYGEIDSVEARWTRDFRALPADCVLVTCADDPRVEAIARASGHSVRRFALSSSPPDRSEAGGADGSWHGASAIAGVDSACCPTCGHRLAYRLVAVEGLRDWECPSCGTRRADPDLLVASLGADEAGWSRLIFEEPGGRQPIPDVAQPIRVRLTGTAGAYDSAAAILAAEALGVERVRAVEALDGATPAFGRLEEIDVGGKHVVLTLAKNPSSVAQAAEAVAVRQPDALLIGLGDRPADGRDPSWIWDSMIDRLPAVDSVVLTGSRAEDVGLRFKYSTDQVAEGRRRPRVRPPIKRAIDDSLDAIRPGGTLMVLATYTTLLAIRDEVQRRSVSPRLAR
jgi:lipid II isoglutaminyl synthase (glutamine-hydrolysing)